MEDIIKINYMSEIDDYVSELNPNETILFFDIDNTILRTISDIGSAEWIKWQEKLLCNHDGKHEYSIANTYEELYILYRQWLLTSNCLTELVEEYVDTLINKYIDDGFKVVLVTARDEITINTTIEQISRHYNINKFFSHDLYFKNKKLLFCNGVLFGTGGRKGDAISNLLSIIKSVFDFEPKNIVFIDDSVSECLSVANKFACNKIKSFVFNYLNSQKYYQEFNKIEKHILHQKWLDFIKKIQNNKM